MSPELIPAAHSEEVPVTAVGSEHIQSCFERYQSYRPEDMDDGPGLASQQTEIDINVTRKMT